MRYLDGTPCDWRAAVIRNGFRFLDWFPGVYMIGGFAIASTRRRQRLGDQAAGTSVYRRADLAEPAADAAPRARRTRVSSDLDGDRICDDRAREAA